MKRDGHENDNSMKELHFVVQEARVGNIYLIKFWSFRNDYGIKDREAAWKIKLYSNATD